MPKLGNKILFGALIFAVALSPLTPAVSAEEPYVPVRNGNNIDVDWDDVESAVDYSVSVFENGVQTETVSTENVSAYQDIAILPNIEYRYDISVTKPVDVENPEVTETVLLLQTAPVKYALDTLRASVYLASYNSIGVNINSVYGVDSYDIYRSAKKSSGYKKIANTTSTSYVNKSLSLNKGYYYKIRGIQTVDGKKYYTNTTSALGKKTSLGKTKLKLAAVSYKSARLSWTESQGATKYHIYRSTHKTRGYKKIKTTTSQSYSNSSLKTGTRYYYKIKPARLSAVGPTSNAVSAKPYLKKTQITRIDLKLGKATVRWSKVSGASGYKVYRATSVNGKYKAIKKTKSTSYTNSKLKSNKAYYYKVKPYRKVGKKVVYAGASSYLKTVTPRKSGQYRYSKSTYVVLRGSGYYSVCQRTSCNWYGNDYNDNFENRAYVYVPAGWYLTFDTYGNPGSITSASYYYNTPKSSFTTGGYYIVGYDLKAGNYRLSSNKSYYYDITGSGDYYENDFVNNGSSRYITLYEGDMLTVSSYGASRFKGVRY